MFFMRGRDVFGFEFFEHGFEVNVLRLVVRRVGIGDIAREYFHALAANAKRFLVDSECC